jgi:hypothetical protein
LKNVDEPSTLQENGETVFAISPDDVAQKLKFSAAEPYPHPVEPRSGVSKDEGPSAASWFKTALTASSP